MSVPYKYLNPEFTSTQAEEMYDNLISITRDPKRKQEFINAKNRLAEHKKEYDSYVFSDYPPADTIDTTTGSGSIEEGSHIVIYKADPNEKRRNCTRIRQYKYVNNHPVSDEEFAKKCPGMIPDASGGAKKPAAKKPAAKKPAAKKPAAKKPAAKKPAAKKPAAKKPAAKKKSQ